VWQVQQHLDVLSDRTRLASTERAASDGDVMYGIVAAQLALVEDRRARRNLDAK
jgi:hypothetical protein